MKGWEKINPANAQEEKKGGWGAVLISDKIDFKTKAIKRDTEGEGGRWVQQGWGGGMGRKDIQL